MGLRRSSPVGLRGSGVVFTGRGLESPCVPNDYGDPNGLSSIDRSSFRPRDGGPDLVSESGKVRPGGSNEEEGRDVLSGSHPYSAPTLVSTFSDPSVMGHRADRRRIVCD